MAVQHTRDKFGKTFTDSYTVCVKYTVNFNTARTAATGVATHKMYNSSSDYTSEAEHIETYVTPVTYSVDSGMLRQPDADCDNALIAAQGWSSTSLV